MERERETDRQTEKETERKRDGDRDTEIQRQTETHKQRDRQTETHRQTESTELQIRVQSRLVRRLQTRSLNHTANTVHRTEDPEHPHNNSHFIRMSGDAPKTSVLAARESNASGEEKGRKPS